jgi:hypothetical protein
MEKKEYYAHSENDHGKLHKLSAHLQLSNPYIFILKNFPITYDVII